MNHHYKNRRGFKLKNKQQGLVLILVTFMMIVMLFFSALAIDYNHAISNKTQLQNVVDSAALAGASKINEALVSEAESIDQNEVELAINNTLSKMVEPGNSTVVIEYLASPSEPATKTTTMPTDGSKPYVRVDVSDVGLESYFTQVFGVGKQVSASALSGPAVKVINQVCDNIIPVGVCSSGGESSNYGYQANNAATSDEYDQDTPSSPFYDLMVKHGNGPGNWGFLAIDNDNGANNLSEKINGGIGGCLTVGDSDGDDYIEDGQEGNIEVFDITTEPGNKLNSGPVNSAYNSRFDDVDTVGTYKDYLDNINGCTTQECRDNLSEAYAPRIVGVPIINCSVSGRKSVHIETLGCFFLTEEAYKQGGTWSMNAQYIGDCTDIYGESGNNGGLIKVITEDKVQLYKDPLSGES